MGNDKLVALVIPFCSPAAYDVICSTQGSHVRECGSINRLCCSVLSGQVFTFWHVFEAKLKRWIVGFERDARLGPLTCEVGFLSNYLIF
jgi:hypothetical protein